MEVMNFFANEQRINYKCYDELKNLLCNNDKFRLLIEKGYLIGKIQGFSEEIWKKIQAQNIRRIRSFEDVFIEGTNIGYCTVASKQLSYSFENCFICGGVLPILKGSKNCEDGSHTWIVHNGKIIDTTLMLIIDLDYAKTLGYIEQNRYNPNLDPVYSAAKEFTLDQNLRKK